MDTHAPNGALDSALLLTALFLVLGFLAVLKRWRNAVDPPLPPGPRGVPFLGYLPFLGKNFHREFAELARTYGPIYKIWLGNQLWVVIGSPSLMKEISRDHDTVFANRGVTVAASTISHGRRDIAFADHGPYWRKMRKVFVREMMSSSSLDACSGLRKEEMKKSIISLHNQAGSLVDIGQQSQFLSVDVVMAMLCGNTLKGEKRERLKLEFRRTVEEIMVLLGEANISDLVPVLARFDLQGVERKAKALARWLENFIDSLIPSAIEGTAIKVIEEEDGAGDGGKRKDFLQILLELQMEGEENGPTSISKKEELQGMLNDVVVGGTDTTSTMVEWVMAAVLHRKPVLEKIMEELTEVVGLNNLVEEFHLPKLTYLDAVIQETFRLHPAFTLLNRRSPSQSVTIGGYTIPKGARVFVNIWAIQRDPALWNNPLDFKPERFLGDVGKIDYSGNNFTYLPFGSGRRICAGLPLANKMLKYTVASFLHSFEWELTEGTEIEFSDRFGLVTKKMNPLVAIPRPRLSKIDLYQ